MLLGYFNIRSPLNAIMVSTWLHFCSKNLPKSRLGGFLDRLGRILEASESVGDLLEASKRVLGLLRHFRY